jgi:hypothetical protein
MITVEAPCMAIYVKNPAARVNETVGGESRSHFIALANIGKGVPCKNDRRLIVAPTHFMISRLNLK